ncbi:MAG: hypothetical protein E7275_04955 [Pseudobutyrivibrio sp.]|uniref:hypothetical protein n=1 Tax=Pseudobutyrivibrio sp. TaxID=2014367 RepID=UPI0025D23A00|nr:hypothetical protein [Pseudobutyrivibrio sp.]MBE5903617.1 hypothetical protein [Pseudobutyrivibrio sp.]
MKKIIYELKKTNYIKMLLMYTVVLVAGNLLIQIMYNSNSNSEILEEKKMYEEGLEANDEELNELFKKELVIIDYCIENNISYKSLSAITNLEKNKILVPVVLILIVICRCKSITVENENKTWILLKMYIKEPRRIWVMKNISGVCQTLVMLGLFVVIALLYGTLKYQSFENIKLIYDESRVVVGNYTGDIVNMLSSLTLKAIIYGELGYLMVMCIDSKIVIAGLWLIIVMENNIYNLLSSYRISKLLPFEYFDTFENLVDRNIQQIFVAILYMLGFVIVIKYASLKILKKSLDGGFRWKM